MLQNTSRRFFLASAFGAGAIAAPPDTYRVAVIGHTGKGNYGHGVDLVWNFVDRAKAVAVADANPAGRAAAGKRIGVTRLYADYREMLRQEKPHLVGVGPRTLEEREQMVTAAAEAGAHIFTEKPFARSPVEADRMVEAVRRSRVKLAVAHQMRVSPYMLRAKAVIDSGELGDIQEVRTRGKEDRRAGGEDLMVLGSHLCDMMRFFLGDPQWVTSHVTSNGEEMTDSDVRQGTEPIGPIAGKQIAAMFAFSNGVHGYFASRATTQTDPLRFGMWIYGSKGVLFLPMGIYPDGALYKLSSPAWLPDERNRWERVEVVPDAATRTLAAKAGKETANALMVSDLLRAVEQNGKPCCDELDGRWTIEMIHGIYQAQKTGLRVTFPLKSRSHPLEA